MGAILDWAMALIIGAGGLTIILAIFIIGGILIVFYFLKDIIIIPLVETFIDWVKYKIETRKLHKETEKELERLNRDYQRNLQMEELRKKTSQISEIKKSENQIGEKQ